MKVTAMFLNTKLLFLAVLISSTLVAQQTETTPETQPEQEDSGSRVGSVIVGAYLPIAFGDNFVTNGMDLSLGAKVAFKVNAYKGIYVGPYLSFFSGDVTDQDLLGNYQNTVNITVGGVLGYDFYVNNFDISLGVGLGHSVYSNRGLGDSFNDTATAVWFSPEVNYRFNPYLGVFVAPELRHDFMAIDVPAELEDTFKGVNYFNISFGLRINLGTAYKYM